MCACLYLWTLKLTNDTMTEILAFSVYRTGTKEKNLKLCETFPSRVKAKKVFFSKSKNTVPKSCCMNEWMNECIVYILRKDPWGAGQEWVQTIGVQDTYVWRGTKMGNHSDHSHLDSISASKPPQKNPLEDTFHLGKGNMFSWGCIDGQSNSSSCISPSPPYKMNGDSEAQTHVWVGQAWSLSTEPLAKNWLSRRKQS